MYGKPTLSRGVNLLRRLPFPPSPCASTHARGWPGGLQLPVGLAPLFHMTVGVQRVDPIGPGRCGELRAMRDGPLSFLEHPGRMGGRDRHLFPRWQPPIAFTLNELRGFALKVDCSSDFR
jgi:hypothetical protein